MPKIPHSPIRMYFLLQPPGSNGNMQTESECKACGLRMKGNHASNMERHVRRSHPQIYEKYLELKQRTILASNTGNEFVDAQAFQGLDLKFEPANFIKIKKIRQTAYEKPLSTHSLTTSANKQRIVENILEACVELVTTNGRPFSLINDSGMRTLINLSLPQESVPIGINENTVKELVTQKAEKLKLSILEKVKDSIMNVKVDIITLCNRSFMGISIYYYDQGELFSHMISFTEINVRYDSNELESLIWRELQRFDTVQQRVYCIVIDSGSNLSTPMNEIVLEGADPLLEINDIANIPSVNTNIEDSIENINCTTNVKMKNDPVSSISEDGEANVRVITVFTENEDEENDLDWSTTEIIVGKLTFESQFNNDDSTPITGMRCVADILQMAVYDSLKSYEDVSDVIKEARSLYQKLLALSEKKIITVNLPPSISLIRWKSIFVMLEKIVAMKSACIKLGLIGEDEQFWIQIEDLISSLKPCQMTSDILQKERLTIGDVYKVWFNCILETSKIESPFAKILTECMRQKQIELFNDKIFLAALFLDPRFNNMILSDAQKKVAIDHLVACHRKFSSDRTSDKESQPVETSEEIDELEKIFQMQESSKPKDDAQTNKTDQLEIILKNFCDSEPRLKTTESVVSFWEKKKAQYPQIYNLARIMFSVPATQQSFLKLVSQVQYAMNADIGQMSETLFNDIVLLRSNS